MASQLKESCCSNTSARKIPLFIENPCSSGKPEVVWVTFHNILLISRESHEQSSELVTPSRLLGFAWCCNVMINIRQDACEGDTLKQVNNCFLSFVSILFEKGLARQDTDHRGLHDLLKAGLHSACYKVIQAIHTPCFQGRGQDCWHHRLYVYSAPEVTGVCLVPQTFTFGWFSWFSGVPCWAAYYTICIALWFPLIFIQAQDLRTLAKTILVHRWPMRTRPTLLALPIGIMGKVRFFSETCQNVPGWAGAGEDQMWV